MLRRYNNVRPSNRIRTEPLFVRDRNNVALISTMAESIWISYIAKYFTDRMATVNSQPCNRQVSWNTLSW